MDLEEVWTWVTQVTKPLASKNQAMAITFNIQSKEVQLGPSPKSKVELSVWNKTLANDETENT